MRDHQTGWELSCSLNYEFANDCLCYLNFSLFQCPNLKTGEYSQIAVGKVNEIASLKHQSQCQAYHRHSMDAGSLLPFLLSPVIRLLPQSFWKHHLSSTLQSKEPDFGIPKAFLRNTQRRFITFLRNESDSTEINLSGKASQTHGSKYHEVWNISTNSPS